MRAISRVGQMADMLFRAVLALAIGNLACVVFLQVVARYVFQAPPFWTEELARFSLIWLTFIGAVVVHAERSHIRVDALPMLLRGRPRILVEIAISLIVLVVLVVITKAGFDIAMMGTQEAPALGISMRVFYMALPIGAAAMALVTVGHLAAHLVALVRGGIDDVA
jgi:TRAP-type C4-dicarboxylate transport system permease small subunit